MATSMIDPRMASAGKRKLLDPYLLAKEKQAGAADQRMGSVRPGFAPTPTQSQAEIDAANQATADFWAGKGNSPVLRQGAATSGWAQSQQKPLDSAQYGQNASTGSAQGRADNAGKGVVGGSNSSEATLRPGFAPPSTQMSARAASGGAASPMSTGSGGGSGIGRASNMSSGSQAIDPSSYPYATGAPPPSQPGAGSPPPAPYGGGYQPVYTQSGYPMSAVNSSEPGRMSEQDRQMIYSQGGQIDSDLQNRIMQQNVEAAQAGGRATGLYGGLADRPGYTAEEQAGIRQQEQLDALKYDPSVTQNMQLTDAELGGAMGDPSKALGWFDPAYTGDIAETGARDLQGAYETGGSDVRGRFDTGAGRVSDAISSGAAGQRGAIDAKALQMDPNAAARVQGAVDSTGRNVRDAIDYDKLKLDAAGLKMSDAEREGYVGRAQRQVGNQYRALQDDVELRAAQSGNASPMAVAVAKERLARGSASDMADARAVAELSAQAAQRDTYRTAEQMRQDAERGYSGLRSGAEMRLGDQAIEAGLNTEGMRLQAQQGLTGFQTAAERDIANRGVAAEEGQQKLGVGMAEGQQRLGMDSAQAGAKMRQDANMFNQDTGIRAFQTADEQAAARALALAQNRQDVVRYGDTSQFNRTTAIADRGSAAAQGIGNARREDTTTAAGGFSQARDAANQNINTAQGQRVENYGTQSGAANAATRAKQQYELGRSQQGWGGVLKNVAGGVLSAAAGGLLKKAPGMKP